VTRVLLTNKDSSRFGSGYDNPGADLARPETSPRIGHGLARLNCRVPEP